MEKRLSAQVPQLPPPKALQHENLGLRTEKRRKIKIPRHDIRILKNPKKNGKIEKTKTRRMRTSKKTKNDQKFKKTNKKLKKTQNQNTPT